MQKALAIKCVIILIIGFLLLIPLLMVSGKISERRSYQIHARDSIAQSWTGQQTLLTPILVLPYTVEVSRQNGIDKNDNPLYKTSTEWRKRLIVPDSLGINSQVDTEMRWLGIYGIPVYSSNFSMEGQFDADNLSNALQELQLTPGFLNLGDAYLAINLADIRGIDGLPTVTWRGDNLAFESNSGIDTLESGIHAPLPVIISDRAASFKVELSLRGMESLRLIPAAKQLTVDMASPWPHPQFSGAFLPQSHDISAEGFRALWRINHFSTGIEQLMTECEAQNCYGLDHVEFGVTFIEAVDIYLQSERSLKYGILFIGLSFIAFFMFETLRKIAIHPVQYALVGFALALFFLLLTSLSEHLSFAIAYLIATSACVLLLTYYLRFVLRAWKETIIFAVSLTGLYGVLFVIVGAEDFALLMGSGLIFAVLTGIMIVTRNIDWYGLRETIDER